MQIYNVPMSKIESEALKLDPLYRVQHTICRLAPDAQVSMKYALYLKTYDIILCPFYVSGLDDDYSNDWLVTMASSA